MSERALQIRIWDLPTRLFHWSIVVLIGVSWLAESRGWMELHFLSGYCVITLLLFRLAWGIVGSETARFSHFLKGPWMVLRHLVQLRWRESDTEIGHNAAGGWMVLVMLALLAIQAATGLCANDDADTEGPLFSYVGKEWSDWLSHVHAVNFRLIQIAVLVHLAAILAYAVLKRHDLVRPMITGQKQLPATVTPPVLVHQARAIVVFAVAAAAVALFVNAL